MMISHFFSQLIALGLGLGSLAWIAVAGAATQGDSIPYAADLARESELCRVRQVPLLILFTAPNCAFCERVRQEFLLPMQRNPEYADKVVFRQVDMRSPEKLLNFSGKATSHAQFAKLHKVSLTPTIKLFDAAGNVLTEPMVGLSTPDFYGVYLDRAIDEALGKIRGTARP